MPTNDLVRSAHPKIEVAGSLLAPEYMGDLVEMHIESSFRLPDMLTLVFLDPELTLMSSGPFEIGKPIKASMAEALSDSVAFEPIFDGEIVAIEGAFEEATAPSFIVRAYDKRHRLTRGTQIKTFLEQKDSDIISQIVSGAGLSGEATQTIGVHKYIIQDNISDMEFLYERAERNGYQFYFSNGQLKFQKPQEGGTTVTLKWGVDLLRFSPRISAVGQVGEVMIRGWDPTKKEAIVGQATTPTTTPTGTSAQSSGGAAANSFGTAKRIEVRRPVETVDEANALAQAILDQINSSYIQASGYCNGQPKILAGNKVKIEGCSAKFNGTYTVTTARHSFTLTYGYRTEFEVEGPFPELMSDLIGGSKAGHGYSNWGGVVIGLVTNNNDPDAMNRVKVKFPWLGDTIESHWARVLVVGGGNERGIAWMPEINDEVLVAFEHGDMTRPYILGGLWNGNDKAPDGATLVESGNVEVRTIKTRVGHIIRLTDKSGSEKIEIIGKDTTTKIILDVANKKISIEGPGDIEVKVDQNMKFSAPTGDISIEGKNVTIKAQQNLNAEATANLGLKGTAGAKLESSGIAEVKGSMVKVN